MTLILIALKLILVVILSANISRMSYGAAFFVAALVFGIMAVYGKTTNRDLSSIESMGSMALIGIIVASLINLLLKNDVVSCVISYITLGVFIILTAYDTRKNRLKKFSYIFSPCLMCIGCRISINRM